MDCPFADRMAALTNIRLDHILCPQHQCQGESVYHFYLMAFLFILQIMLKEFTKFLSDYFRSRFWSWIFFRRRFVFLISVRLFRPFLSHPTIICKAKERLGLHWFCSKVTAHADSMWKLQYATIHSRPWVIVAMATRESSWKNVLCLNFVSHIKISAESKKNFFPLYRRSATLPRFLTWNVVFLSVWWWYCADNATLNHQQRVKHRKICTFFTLQSMMDTCSTATL